MTTLEATDKDNSHRRNAAGHVWRVGLDGTRTEHAYWTCIKETHVDEMDDVMTLHQIATALHQDDAPGTCSIRIVGGFGLLDWLGLGGIISGCNIIPSLCSSKIVRSRQAFTLTFLSANLRLVA